MQRTVRAARRRMSSDERRQEIIRLSAKLFDERGYVNATMDDIATAVGVAKPTLYHYFSSKDDILQAIHEEFIALLIDRHRSRIASDVPTDKMLLGTMTDILDLMDTHHGHVRVFFEHHRELPAPARRSIRQKRGHYERLVEDVIAQGIENGTFAPTDPHLAALAMFGMCNWAYQWYRPRQEPPSRDIARQFWGYLMHGLNTTTPGPA